MAVLRLANGSDVPVKLTLQEVIERLNGDGAGSFVELPGEDGPVMLRPEGVIAIIEDTRRSTAGFRVGGVASSAP